MPSSATVASAIARRRARPARGVKAGPVPSQTSLRDHCHPARVYRSRVAQPRRSRSAMGFARRPRRGAQAPLPDARGGVVRRAGARKAYTSLRSGLSPRAKSLSSTRRRTATRMRSARAGRSSPAPSPSKTSRISRAPSVEMPATVRARRFAPPSLTAHRRERGRVRVWGRYALSGRSRAIDRGRPQRQWRSHRALASPSAAVCAH